MLQQDPSDPNTLSLDISGSATSQPSNAGGSSGFDMVGILQQQFLQQNQSQVVQQMARSASMASSRGVQHRGPNRPSLHLPTGFQTAVNTLMAPNLSDAAAAGHQAGAAAAPGATASLAAVDPAAMQQLLQYHFQQYGGGQQQ